MPGWEPREPASRGLQRVSGARRFAIASEHPPQKTPALANQQVTAPRPGHARALFRTAAA